MKTKNVKKTRRTFNGHHFTVNFWALITILSLPVAMFLASHFFQVSYVRAFFVGVLASIVVLCVNVFLEGRLWFYHPDWIARLEAPDFSFRLAVVSGVIFLMMETALIFLFFTSPTLDRSLVGLVFGRQCAQPKGDFVQICGALNAPVTVYEAE